MIKDINEVHLIGRVGNEPQVRQFGERACCNLNVVTHESFKNKAGEWQEIPSWHSVVIWTSRPDNLKQITKGSIVDITGKLNYRKYTNRDGIEVNITEIAAKSYKVLIEDKSGQAVKEAPQAPAEQAVDDGDLPF